MLNKSKWQRHNHYENDNDNLCMMFMDVHSEWLFWHEVGVLAGGELVAVFSRLNAEDQTKLAMDWSLAMDLVLTELKVAWIIILWDVGDVGRGP